MKHPAKCAMGLVAALLLAPAALAHHSFAMFDHSRTVTIPGTVRTFQWTNPHVVLWVYGNPETSKPPVLWWIELTSPGNLARLGWTRHSFNVGDHVAVDIYPLRDGSRGGGFRRATLTDTGQVLSTNAQDRNTSAQNAPAPNSPAPH